MRLMRVAHAAPTSAAVRYHSLVRCKRWPEGAKATRRLTETRVKSSAASAGDDRRKERRIFPPLPQPATQSWYARPIQLAQHPLELLPSSQSSIHSLIVVHETE